jgi:hypothetical protein
MEGKQRDKWWQLCAQAADEQDPAKLLQLTSEINRLLQEQQRRATAERDGKTTSIAQPHRGARQIVSLHQTLGH